MKWEKREESLSTTNSTQYSIEGLWNRQNQRTQNRREIRQARNSQLQNLVVSEEHRGKQLTHMFEEFEEFLEKSNKRLDALCGGLLPGYRATELMSKRPATISRHNSF